MRSKVSSDWLPSYIKATRPVLGIFKMAGYFPDRPRSLLNNYQSFQEISYILPQNPHKCRIAKDMYFNPSNAELNPICHLLAF
jgi:hypothetical protein